MTGDDAGSSRPAHRAHHVLAIVGVGAVFVLGNLTLAVKTDNGSASAS